MADTNCLKSRKGNDYSVYVRQWNKAKSELRKALRNYEKCIAKKAKKYLKAFCRYANGKIKGRGVVPNLTTWSLGLSQISAEALTGEILVRFSTPALSTPKYLVPPLQGQLWQDMNINWKKDTVAHNWEQTSSPSELLICGIDSHGEVLSAPSVKTFKQRLENLGQITAIL